MKLLVMTLTKWECEPCNVVLASSVVEFNVVVAATNYANGFCW